MQETGNKISFDTAKTLLVPAEMYERGVEEDYLRFNGMALGAGETAVASEATDGIVAIMGIPSSEWESFKHRYERGEVSVTSPLLCVAARQGRRKLGLGLDLGRKRSVNIFLTGDNLYLAVWDSALRMAEVFPDNSVDSLLYYIQVVGRSFALRRFDINVDGEGADIAAEALRQYYKKVRVVIK